MDSTFERPGSSGEDARFQSVIKWQVESPGLGDPGNITAWLRDKGVRYEEGPHSFYLPPQPALSSLLPNLVDFYPPNAGYSILKDRCPSQQASTLKKDAFAFISERALNGRLTFGNYLYSKGLGPRLWDVCAWESSGAVHTVFVTDHLDGRSPRTTDCMHSLIQRFCPGSREQADQDFAFCSTGAWTEEILGKGEQLFHFGAGRSFRPSKYLYQSVPGMDRPGKRNSLARWQLIIDTLQAAGIEFEGRVVLDIGCNAGMMLYLSLVCGAYWGFGWDHPDVTVHTQDLLHSLGMSRFNVKGADLFPPYDIAKDLPERLVRYMDESVLFYLAVYGHIGLMSSINHIPWRIFVFEGHQGEDLEEVGRLLNAFLDYDVRLLSKRYLEDGDSSSRPIMILARK